MARQSGHEVFLVLGVLHEEVHGHGMTLCHDDIVTETYHDLGENDTPPRLGNRRCWVLAKLAAVSARCQGGAVPLPNRLPRGTNR